MNKCITIILTSALLGIVASCGMTSKVLQDNYAHTTDTLYQDRIKIDSIFIRDSIYVHSKADTVWQYRDRYEYRYIYLRDTAYFAVHDTLKVDVVKYIKEELPLFQKVKAKAFWYLVSCLLFLLLLLFGGKYFRRIFSP